MYANPGRARGSATPLAGLRPAEAQGQWLRKERPRGSVCGTRGGLALRPPAPGTRLPRGRAGAAPRPFRETRASPPAKCPTRCPRRGRQERAGRAPDPATPLLHPDPRGGGGAGAGGARTAPSDAGGAGAACPWATRRTARQGAPAPRSQRRDAAVSVPAFPGPGARAGRGRGGSGGRAPPGVGGSGAPGAGPGAPGAEPGA